MNPRFHCALMVLMMVLSASSAFADVPDNYNAVRCRRVEDPSVAVHVAIYRNEALNLFWIENDRVTLLSNELEHHGSVVTGRQLGGNEFYELDYQKQTFTVRDQQGKVIRKESNLSCVMCPIEMDFCPGDELGHGTNIPHPNL